MSHPWNDVLARGCPPTEAWQRELRPGDRFVAAVRGPCGITFRWVVVCAAPSDATYVSARRYSDDTPDGVAERVCLRDAVFPITEAQFLAARRAGWPRRLRAVQALAALVRGGEA